MVRRRGEEGGAEGRWHSCGHSCGSSNHQNVALLQRRHFLDMIQTKQKQHDTSAVWIKEESCNQHAGVYYHPPSFTLLLPQPFSLVGYQYVHGGDDPISVSIFASLCLPLASWGRDWRLRPSIIGLTAGPRRGWPCYLDSVMTSSKGAPPSLTGLAWLRFGLEPPCLLWISIENREFTYWMLGSC